MKFNFISAFNQTHNIDFKLKINVRDIYWKEAVKKD